MNSRQPQALLVFLLSFTCVAPAVAQVVPTDIQQPGTQPGEVTGLELATKCDNCHGGYDKAVEPAFNWRGSMMAHATRDPIFWATVAIAEQDFGGSGDLCIRCHTMSGWLDGRSVPTDGSALTAADSEGVNCDTCHKMTNSDRSEHQSVMNPPFIANGEQVPATGYFGSAMLAMSAAAAKLGPYSDAAATHQFAQSRFHRSVDFCGSCHDVSNPAVGDLAHNNGAQVPLAPGTFSGVPGAPVAGKAAFNNFPHQYGVVERTFSEYKAGALSKTRVSNYTSLPTDLKAGAIRSAYESSGGDYADGTPRFFSCQTCHMRAVTGYGCNKSGAPLRTDLPLHDLTGGNYWMPDAILHQNANGTLRLGGGMTAGEIEAINAGKGRAAAQLQMAASLDVDDNTLRIVNLTGHKLISGYPEGRRMWINVRWYDVADVLLREDGKFGPLEVTVDGTPRTVQTILDLAGTNTRIYEAHFAMTQTWANQLLALGKPASLPLAYDRTNGSVTLTLGQLAALEPGSYRNTFHFVLNNHLSKDNRIPPYGMAYDEARVRNVLPVPATQYGGPGPGGVFNYWDELTLQPPAGATRATIALLYQPTSWEYIQFLYLANDRSNDFLKSEGVNLLDTWMNSGMAAPFTMATTSWQPNSIDEPDDLIATATSTNQVHVSWQPVADADSYELFRSSGGADYALLTTTSSTSVDDAVSAGTTYLYKVRTVTSGGAISAFSNVDAATTVIFSDAPLVPLSTTVKAAHMNELRTAVTAMRTAAGLAPFVLGPAPVTGSIIAATHVTQLRDALVPARLAIGLPPLSLTDETLQPAVTRIKAAHVEELREGCR